MKAAGDTNAQVGRALEVSSQNMSKIVNRPEVQARINELSSASRDRILAKSELNKEWVLDEIKSTYKAARDAEQHGAANQSLKLAGTELGMFAQRVEVAHLDSVLEGLSRDELRLRLAQACSEVGMRVVDMTDEATRDWILRNAERVGLEVRTRELQ